MGNKFGNVIIKHKINNPSFLNNKIIAIDGSILIYKFCAIFRDFKGDLLASKKGVITSHIYGLFRVLTRLLKNKSKIIFVIDGKPSSIKDNTLQKRRERLSNALKIQKYLVSINSKNTTLLKSIKQKTIKITREMIDTLETFLNFLGVPLIKANGEGESQCVWLVKNNIADLVISDDWDVLLYDIPEFYRSISFKNSKFECQYVNIDENLSNLNLTKPQLLDSVILIGTDYNLGVPKVGPITSIKLISKYGKIQNLIDNSSELKYDLTNIKNYQEIRDHIFNLQNYIIRNLQFPGLDLIDL